MINAYLDRLAVLSKKSYVQHVAIFKNHGRDAGASLSHAHTQLIVSPILPTLFEEELEAGKKYWNKNHECILCNVLKKENEGPRFVWETNNFVAFTPWASVNPLEFWIFPKRHQSTMLNLSTSEVTDLAETIRLCLGGLRSLLNDPPYNFGFHAVLSEDVKHYYHWYLEVFPRLAIWASFEKSTGMFINTISPEDAATELRSAIQVEKKVLQ